MMFHSVVMLEKPPYKRCRIVSRHNPGIRVNYSALGQVGLSQHGRVKIHWRERSSKMSKASK